MKNKKYTPTSYVVLIWNEDGSKLLQEEVYPMHLYSFDDVVNLLKGKEDRCDIYESKYWKERGKYITVGDTYEWDGFKWTA